MSDGETQEIPQSFAEFEKVIREGKQGDKAANYERSVEAEGNSNEAENGAVGDENLENEGVGGNSNNEPENGQAGEDDEAPEQEEGKDGEHKRRSKPAAQRIAELTAKLREAERERDALKKPPPAEEAKAPEKPDPKDFEFGEADPAYIDKLTDWKIETREHERDAETKKADDAKAERQAMADKISEGVASAEEAAKAKYDDFDDRLSEAVEARGGEPLPPVLTIGIGVSPVGGDILYRLATDEAASERLEALAKGGSAGAFAMAFGEFEGEYLDSDDDSDLDLADPADMARLNGRMKARLRGLKAGKPAEKPAAEALDTKAPEPPAHQARGAGGRFEVDANTSDFAAFEKKVNGARR